jgi:hypothetical protein
LQGLQLAFNRGEIDRATFVDRARSLAGAQADKRAAEMTADLKYKLNDPRSLDDLPQWRTLLTQSDNLTSRLIGQRLEELQNACQQGGSTAHGLFQGTAENLAEYIIENRGFIPTQHYDRASADLGLQCTRFQEQLERQPARAAFSSRASDNLNDALMRLRAPASSLFNAREAVTQAMRNGANAEQAVAQALEQRPMTHADDLQAMQEHATQLANSGGPRATPSSLFNARGAVTQAMRNGANAEQAVAEALEQHPMTHADDLQAMQEHATQLANSGGGRR